MDDVPPRMVPRSGQAQPTDLSPNPIEKTTHEVAVGSNRACDSLVFRWWTFRCFVEGVHSIVRDARDRAEMPRVAASRWHSTVRIRAAHIGDVGQRAGRRAGDRWGRCEQKPRDRDTVWRMLVYQNPARDSTPIFPTPGWTRTVIADRLVASIEGGLGRDKDPCDRALLLLTVVDLDPFACDGRQRYDGWVRRDGVVLRMDAYREQKQSGDSYGSTHGDSRLAERAGIQQGR